MDGTYGKYGTQLALTQIIMEYEPFLSILPAFLPSNNTNSDFNAYLTNNSSALFQFADVFYYTLPEPRYTYY